MAILAVVAFHAWPSVIPGGFVGVDVFFVISGYLITRIITAPNFSFSTFYQRRVRRLFPSLAVVLVATLCLGQALLAPNDFRNLLRYAIGSTFFAGNVVAYTNDSYFNGASELKPLVHLWSLGVEEQFYLLWPALVTFAAARGLLVRSIGILAAISFGAFLWFSESDPRAAFYLAPPRFWELLVGAAVACITMPRWTRLGGYASTAGLILIALSVAFIDSSVTFPGLLLAAPVIGTALIVAAPGGSGSAATLLLSSRFAVWIGLISYPLYLWHWPLLALLRYYQRSPPATSIAGTIALSILLAELTRRFVERPTYSVRLRPVVEISAAANMAIFFSALLALQNTPAEDRPLTNALCTDRYDYRASSLWFCMKSSPKPPTVLLLGDSHANHLYEGLVHKLPNDSVLSIGACMPTIGLVYHEAPGFAGTCGNEHFDSQSRFINEHVLAESSLRRVYVSAMWRVFDENGSEIDYWTGKKVTTFGPVGSNALHSYAEAVEKQISRIGPVPVTLVLYTPRRGLSLALQRQRQSPLVAEFLALASRHRNVEVFDPMPLMCSVTLCRFNLLGDASHLSSAGSDFLAESLAK